MLKKYSGISIKRTTYQANIFLRRTVTPCTNKFIVKLFQKNLYKADIYKADSRKTDAFFVLQMKISPKATLCKEDTRLKKQFSKKKSLTK